MFLKKQIDTLFLPLGKYWMALFYMMVICFSFIALFIVIAIKFHKPMFFIVGPLLSMLPIILFRLKINSVAKKVTINFSQESIEITTSDTLSERFLYSEIKYFSVSKYASDHS